MRGYQRILVGLAVTAVGLLCIAATQPSNSEQPFEVGSAVSLVMDNNRSKGGTITAISGKWVKFETKYGPQGPTVVEWVNTVYVRTVSFPKGAKTR